MTDAAAPDRLAGAYDAAEAIVRDADRDRWLADLFVPADKRRHVAALQAFSSEIARVRETVREPLPGEVRLQWWRDALEGHGHGDVEGHPAAAALIDTVRRFSLPLAPLVGLIDARTFDLYDDPMPSLLDLEGYAGETASVLFQAAALVLCDGEDPKAADAAGHAGVAYAITGLLRALPIHARRGQVFVPADVLARHGAGPDDIRAAKPTPAVEGALAEMREHARHHLARAMAALDRVDRRALPAFVPLALVEPYLNALERQRDPFAAVADVASWRKPVLLWRFARRLR
ncbi:phytoene/squalene synthase family protein [Chthonobacter rhizosphaerae]|uniref:phytoene/squalene synthase family protein n=1 Tax=Chthonobacter rhizosphaerae TaxID=2735553 RepID=UPI0015EE5F3E|nr:phytoene/squalene synthase family protein [Chthonobacter rhizosphaerae]